MHHFGLQLDVLKTVQGFTPILKAVIRAQILTLVDQLSEQTGEQMVILSANIGERTFCHFGSNDGKDFLAGREDVQKGFLQYCVDKHSDRQKTFNYDDSYTNEGDRKPSDIAGKETEADSGLKRTRQNDITTRQDSRYKSLHDMVKARIRKREKTGNGDMEESVNSVERKKRRRKGRSRDKGDSVTEHCAEEVQSYDKTGEAPETSGSVDDLVKARSEVAGDCHMGETLNQRGACNTFTARDSDHTGVSGDEFGNTEDVKKEDRFGSAGDNTRLEEEIAGEQTAEEDTKNRCKTVSGKPLDEDLRMSIIFKVIEGGGEVEHGTVPRGVLTRVSRALGVNVSSVSRIWERYVNDGTVKARPRQQSWKT